MLSRKHERGDTIVEVLFAVAIFALIVVGGISLMNQGTAASQRALESTLVRQQMDAQAETLRFLHNSYTASYQPGQTFVLTDSQTSPAEEWYRMVTYARNNGATRSTEFGYCPNYAANQLPPAGSFFLDSRSARVITRDIFPNSMAQPQTWAQVEYPATGTLSRGIWIEAVRSPNSTDPNQAHVGYIDFHIRACWDTLGMNDMMKLGTIVRLYEPR